MYNSVPEITILICIYIYIYILTAPACSQNYSICCPSTLHCSHTLVWNAINTVKHPSALILYLYKYKYQNFCLASQIKGLDIAAELYLEL